LRRKIRDITGGTGELLIVANYPRLDRSNCPAEYFDLKVIDQQLVFASPFWETAVA